MISAPVTKEVFISDSAIGRRDDGGTYNSNWAGVGFLVLVFLVLGFALFHRGDNDKVYASIREGHNTNHTGALAQAEFRGESRVRQQDTWDVVRANQRELEDIRIAMANGFNAAVCATKDGVYEVERFGQNAGFSTYAKVYPNPCGEREERRERGCGPRRTVVTPYTPPTQIEFSESVCA
jgi:hypothetical protein